MIVNISKQLDLSDSEVEFLRNIDYAGYAEYRDTASTYQEHLERNPGIDTLFHTEQRFRNRNFGSTRAIALRMHELGLVEGDEMAWHETYTLSPLGREVLASIENGSLLVNIFC